ncbi:hypothetical protein GE061_002096 [Apolygus lucorum]|uniref:Uncharacterized protein n=1 Tax=Apolygus lucorum TaxID=248454 RepID=A0A8S9X5Z7_APOLU|nr:hypothetical protein GE061_002096 [Apolygus lucorum]
MRSVELIFLCGHFLCDSLVFFPLIVVACIKKKENYRGTSCYYFILMTCEHSTNNFYTVYYMNKDTSDDS